MNNCTGFQRGKVLTLSLFLVWQVFLNLATAGQSGEQPQKTTALINVSSVETDRTVSLSVSLDNRLMSYSIDEFEFLSEGKTSAPGRPLLPAVGRWVRVPDRGRLELNYTVSEEIRFQGDAPELCRTGEDGVAVQAPPARDGVWPPAPVTMGRPAIMRGVRVVPITCYPLRWDENRDEYILSRGIEIDIAAGHESGVNEVFNSPAKPSHDFERLLDALLVNPPRRDQDEDYLPGGYLVVANVEMPEAVNEFIDWKRRAGHPVDLLTFDPVAVEIPEVKGMIQDVYDDTGFEFLVFMGSDDAEPPLEIPYDRDYYDTFYAQLEGEDPIPDVAVGGFNCIDVENFTCAIRRAISYQSRPYMGDTDWFTHAAVAVGAVSVPNDLSPSYSGRWFADNLRRSGFDDVETSFYADNGVNDPSPLVEQLYNEGTNFILVRAHEWDLEVDNIDAGEVYPFHFLVSSGTISPPNNGAFNWVFRMGTPEEMRGPSCGFGHNSSPRTNAANALAGGLIQGMFMYDITTYGWARNYAVANLQSVMPDDGEAFRRYYYSHWRYYGDPGQWCWRGVPGEVEAIIEEEDLFDADLNYLSIRVGSDDDEEYDDVTVTLLQGDAIQVVDNIHVPGRATLYLGEENLEPGEFTINITGKSILATTTELNTEDARLFFEAQLIEFDDEENGDGDGIPNAGEAGSFVIDLINRGEIMTPGGRYIFLVNSDNPWIDIEWEVDIQDEPIRVGEAWRVAVPATISVGCPDGESARIVISSMDYGETAVEIIIEAPDFSLVQPNLIIEINEETELSLSILNFGSKDAEDLNATLESLSPYMTVLRNWSAYPPIEAGEEDNLSGDPFLIRSTDNVIPGMMAQFRMIIDGDPGVLDTLYFSLPVGEAEEGDPFGPDSYGYIALDDGDEDVEWAAAPEYDWVELLPWAEEPDFEAESLGIPVGPEADTVEVDSTVLLDLPFMFRYHGRDYRQISVCSNGWIAVGDQTHLKNQQNWPIPGYNGAFGMIAPFWDRLSYNGESDGMYHHYDEDGGRYIIQWAGGVLDRNRDRQDNIFEVILYDPEERDTPTGDSQILFQYNTVNNVQWNNSEANFGATVGIGSPDNMDGLTYTYWDDYPTSCAPLEAGRAILWTTLLYGEQERATIHGTVTRYIDSLGIGDMQVRTEVGFMALTDDEGNYRLRLPLGEYTLTTGGGDIFGELSEDVILDEPDQEVEVNFVLPHGWLDLETDTLLVLIDEFHHGPYLLSITVTNTGNELLEINRLTLEHDSLSWPEDWNIIVDPNQFELPAEESFELNLLFDGVGEIDTGRYYAELVFEGNLPERISFMLVVDVITGIESDEGIIPADYALGSPYPNPFNAATRVRFALPHEGHVRLALYDLSGREVMMLTDERYTTGWHSLSVDAGDLPTGIYFLRLTAGDFVAVKRVVLLR